MESAVSQEQLEISGDDYEDCSKEAFEKFVADLKVILLVGPYLLSPAEGD